MELNDLIKDVEEDIDFHERRLRKDIETIRNLLIRVERDLEKGNLASDSGLNGNEWRIYDEVAKIENLNKTLKQLKSIK